MIDDEVRQSAARPRFPVTRWPVVVCVLVLVSYAGGFVVFANRAARHTIDPVTVTDAIVVLTGGSERFRTAVDLLHLDLSARLFVSGVHPDVGVRALLAEAGAAPALLDRYDVQLGHQASDTAGNAVETAAWAAANAVGSVRLVTSDYHMPRGLLEFRAAMPGVIIVPHAVSAATVHLDEWWLWPGTAQLVFLEYNKVLLAWLRIQVERAWAGVSA